MIAGCSGAKYFLSQWEGQKRSRQRKFKKDPAGTERYHPWYHMSGDV